MKGFNEWAVTLQGKFMESVFFLTSVSAKEVVQSLVDVHGLDSRVKVVKLMNGGEQND